MNTGIKVSCMSALLFGMVACNGAGGTPPGSSGVTPSGSTTATSSIVTVSTDAQIRTPITANSLQAISNSGNSCFILVPTSNGKNYTSAISSAQYYSTASVNFIIQNTCSSSQSISGLVVNITGLTINGNKTSINYIAQGSGNNPYLNLTYTTSGMASPNPNGLGLVPWFR